MAVACIEYCISVDKVCGEQTYRSNGSVYNEIVQTNERMSKYSIKTHFSSFVLKYYFLSFSPRIVSIVLLYRSVSCSRLAGESLMMLLSLLSVLRSCQCLCLFVAVRVCVVFIIIILIIAVDRR